MRGGPDWRRDVGVWPLKEEPAEREGRGDGSVDTLTV